MRRRKAEFSWDDVCGMYGSTEGNRKTSYQLLLLLLLIAGAAFLGIFTAGTSLLLPPWMLLAA